MLFYQEKRLTGDVNGSFFASELDSDTIKNVVILVSCLSGGLVISAFAAICYCKRKRVLCFSNGKDKTKNPNDDAYVLSISRNISHPNNQQAQSSSRGQHPFDAQRTNESRLDLSKETTNNPSNLPEPTITFSSTSTTHNTNPESAVSIELCHNKTEIESNQLRPMQGFISSLVAQYENVPANTAVPNSSACQDSVEDDEFQYSEQMPGKGICRVKCDFDPHKNKYRDTPGLLKIRKDEKLIILQKDLGSGWTCVRNPINRLTGFVPTGSLNMSL